MLFGIKSVFKYLSGTDIADRNVAVYADDTFLVSYPRSGNTWTRLFICNLAALLAGKREEENFNNFLRDSPWDAEVKHYQKYIKLNPAGGEDAIRDMLSVRHLVLRDFAGTEKGLVFAKTHWLLDEAFGHNTFDFSVTAGAIYCVRNPLDVFKGKILSNDRPPAIGAKFDLRHWEYISADAAGGQGG